MDFINRNISDNWPTIYRLGCLSLGGLIAFSIAFKGTAIYSLSEVGLLIAVATVCYKMRKFVQLPDKVVLFAFAIFAVGLIISAISHGEEKIIIETLDYFTRIMVAFFVMYVGVRWFFKSDVFYKAVTVGALVSAVACLMAYICEPGFMSGRRFAPWGNNPNVTVQLLAMNIPFLLLALYKLKSSKLWCLLNAFSFAVIMTGIWMTGSRGGMTGLIAGALLMVTLYWISFKNQWDFRKKIAVSIIMLCLVSFLSMVITANIYSRANSDKARLDILTIASYMFIENPVNGVGFGNFKSAIPNYVHYVGKDKVLQAWVHSHNDLFQWLSTTGGVGAGGYIVFSFIIWWYLLKNIFARKSQWTLWAMMWVTMSLYCHGLVDENIYQRQIAKMYFSLLGLAMAINDREIQDCDKFSCEEKV